MHLSILLDLALRKAQVQIDFFGDRIEASLAKKEAEPLNEVFKQLAGRNHDTYARIFGKTISKDEKHAKPNTIHVTGQARTAISELLDSELRTTNLVPEYKQTLVNLRQKMTPLRAG